MIINDTLMDRIAKLAKLCVKDSDKKRLSQQLSEILEHMKVMDDIDVSDTAPMFHACVEEQPLREDEVRVFDEKPLLDNATQKKDHYFAVPNIIVEEDV